MYKQAEFTIKSISPMLMHDRNKLVNPLHPLTKEVKRFSGKRTKTEEDLMALAKLEWLAGMYLTEAPQIDIQGGNVKFNGGGVPCLPSSVLEGAIINGAKKHKLGTQFKSGILIDQDFCLEYTGPKKLEDMWADGNFTDIRPVQVQRNSIMRCRPIFNAWSATFVINYLPNIVNKDQIQEALESAGQVAGVGDYRPKYGRFLVA
jgi:hypothetical protein